MTGSTGGAKQTTREADYAGKKRSRACCLFERQTRALAEAENDGSIRSKPLIRQLVRKISDGGQG